MKFPLYLLMALLLTSCATSPQSAVSQHSSASRLYTQADVFPLLPGRQPDLIPAPLPPRVRYRLADDATVNRLAARLAAGLTSADPSLYGDLVLVQPGAWSHLKSNLTLDLKDAANLTMMDPAQGVKDGLENGLPGRVFRSRHAVELLAAELSRRLREDGGFHVRALKTREMAKWWIYIGFNIEEPVYVVASEGGKYRFIVTFSRDRVFGLDELNGLPGEG